MFFKKFAPALTLVGFVVLLIVIVAFVSSIWPTQENWFIELGLLGSNKTADAYFYNFDSTLEAGVQNTWYLYVHNHMDRVQDISIRIKILNSTMTLPNDIENEYSPYVHFTELPLSLSINETILVPFTWSIPEVLIQTDSVVIKRLMVNNQIYDVDIMTFSDSFFRMVFELWVYDDSSQEYEFGWNLEENMFSASLYIGFKAVSVLDPY